MCVRRSNESVQATEHQICNTQYGGPAAASQVKYEAAILKMFMRSRTICVALYWGFGELS